MQNSNITISELGRKDQNSALSQPLGRYRAVGEALALGMLLGFVDTRDTGDPVFTWSAYLIAGTFIGLRHAGWACPCWPLLGVSLYVVHVVAIACGRKPPYVEENYRFAEQCLWVMIPSGLGVMVGAGFRAALSAFGWFHRKTDPPVRFLPKTTRDVMVAIACVAAGMGCLHRLMFPPTIYASAYDEVRFHAIREGMTTGQVESALGSPLQKRSWPDGRENWQYSNQYTYASNYERRWIIFSGGFVQEVVSDYWID